MIGASPVTIIFDLDYTLLDTLALKQRMCESVARYGISQQTCVDAIEQLPCDPIAGLVYDPHAHAELLKPHATALPPEADLYEALLEVAVESHRFLYDGAADFLRWARARGSRLMLLTYGEPIWQQAKVDGTGLADLFDRIVMTHAPKTDMLPRLVRADEKVIFVNDNAAETDAVRAANPRHTYVVKRGPKSPPTDPSIAVFDTFDELKRLVESASSAT